MSWLNKLWAILRQKLPSREKLIESIPLILVILYLYGVLIHTVQAGISRAFSAEPPSGPILDWSAATALSTVFSPFGVLFTLIMAGLVFLFTDKFRQWLSGEKLERDKRGFEILYDGLHGTSGWMGKDEQREILQIGPVNELADFPIGKLDEGSQKFAALKNSAYMSGHTIVYGASGSGKTRGCTLPLLMKKIAEGKESLIIVDPKGDLFERTYKLAAENRYTVRALNLLDLDHSDGFNCFDDVERDSSLVSIIAEAIMATTSNKLEREDFWGKAEKNLLMALILYVATLRDQRTGELLPIHERGLSAFSSGSSISATDISCCDAAVSASDFSSPGGSSTPAQDASSPACPISAGPSLGANGLSGSFVPSTSVVSSASDFTAAFFLGILVHSFHFHSLDISLEKLDAAITPFQCGKKGFIAVKPFNLSKRRNDVQDRVSKRIPPRTSCFAGIHFLSADDIVHFETIGKSPRLAGQIKGQLALVVFHAKLRNRIITHAHHDVKLID